jgi:alanine-synthesizing transaminase
LLVTGPRRAAGSYLEGLSISQHAVSCQIVRGNTRSRPRWAAAKSIHDLVLPGGRLREQRDAAMAALKQIPGVTCVQPRARCTCSRA